METRITLYRGDSTDVDEFRFKKTNPHCLVGQGIYLTSKRKVGETYRNKGNFSNTRHMSDTIYKGQALNRPDALEKAFEFFVKIEDIKLFDFVTKANYIWTPQKKKPTKEQKERLDKLRQRYNELIAEDVISAKYVSSISVNKDSQNRALFSMEVVYKHGKKYGCLTTFSFDKREFETGVFKIDRITDSVFWELMYDNQIRIGTPYESKDTYIRHNVPFPPNISNVSVGTFRQIRHVLEPYGYRGFEYSGGLITGGYGYHRAFCIWDEDYVNSHIVERQR